MPLATEWQVQEVRTLLAELARLRGGFHDAPFIWRVEFQHATGMPYELMELVDAFTMEDIIYELRSRLNGQAQYLARQEGD